MSMARLMRRYISFINKDIIQVYIIRFSAVVLQSIAMFVVGIFLGLDDFGRFSFVFSGAQVVSVIFDMGGSIYLQKQLPALDALYDGKGGFSELFFAFYRTMSFVLFVFIFYFLAENFLYPVSGSIANNDFFLILLTGSFFSFLDLMIAIVRVSKNASTSIFLRDALPYLLLLQLLFLLGLFDMLNVETLVLSLCVSLIICFLVSLYIALPYLSRRKEKVNLTLIRNAEFTSFWGSAVIGASLSQIDILIARYFLVDAQLGLYALARRVTNLISLPQVIVNWALNVEVAYQYAAGDGKEILQRQAQKGLVMAVPLAIVMSLFILFLSPYWLSLFKVNVSITIIVVLMIFISAQIFNVLSGANLLFASQCGQQKYVFHTRMLSLIVGVIVMVMGVYVVGPSGLAFGVFISVVLLNFMVTRRVYRTIGVWTSVPFLRI